MNRILNLLGLVGLALLTVILILSLQSWSAAGFSLPREFFTFTTIFLGILKRPRDRSMQISVGVHIPTRWLFIASNWVLPTLQPKSGFGNKLLAKPKGLSKMALRLCGCPRRYNFLHVPTPDRI
jgi:hypothetical protein